MSVTSSVFRTTGACAALLALAACGGGGTPARAPTPAEFEAVAGDALDQIERISSYSRTAFEAMPTTGTATLRGSGGGLIVIDDATDSNIAIFGRSVLRVDFETETFSGKVDEMIGASSETNTFAVGGEIDFSGGSIGVVAPGETSARPNNFLVDYDGSISADGADYAVDGTAYGQFYGTRVNNQNKSVVKGALLEDPNGTATSGGTEYQFVFGASGEN